jgi:hypothetical protein
MVVAVALLAEGHPLLLLLGVAVALLVHDHPLLPAAGVSVGLLTLLVLCAHREARIAVTAALGLLHAETTAAMAWAAAAVEGLHAEAAAAAVTSAAAAVGLGTLSAATATIAAAHLGGAAVSMAATAVRSRSCRGCDRERGNAGREENPGHILSPLNGKTVRSAHRSNRQTDGTCGLPH